MSWFSILPAHLTVVETWVIRLFLLLGIATIGPWAVLIVYDLVLYIIRATVYEYLGGRARGRQKPRAPSLAERPNGRPRSFSITVGATTNTESEAKNFFRERLRNSPPPEEHEVAYE